MCEGKYKELLTTSSEFSEIIDEIKRKKEIEDTEEDEEIPESELRHREISKSIAVSPKEDSVDKNVLHA